MKKNSCLYTDLSRIQSFTNFSFYPVLSLLQSVSENLFFFLLTLPNSLLDLGLISDTATTQKLAKISIGEHLQWGLLTGAFLGLTLLGGIAEIAFKKKVSNLPSFVKKNEILRAIFLGIKSPHLLPSGTSTILNAFYSISGIIFISLFILINLNDLNINNLITTSILLSSFLYGLIRATHLLFHRRSLIHIALLYLCLKYLPPLLAIHILPAQLVNQYSRYLNLFIILLYTLLVNFFENSTLSNSK